MNELHFIFHFTAEMAILLAAAGCVIGILRSKRPQIWVPLLFYFLLLNCSYLLALVESSVSDSENIPLIKMMFYMLSNASLADFFMTVFQFKHRRKLVVLILGTLLFSLSGSLYELCRVFAGFTLISYLAATVGLSKLSIQDDYNEPLLLKLMAFLFSVTGITSVLEQMEPKTFFLCSSSFPHNLSSVINMSVMILIAFCIWEIVWRYYLIRTRTGRIITGSAIPVFLLFLTGSLLLSGFYREKGLRDNVKRYNVKIENIRNNILLNCNEASFLSRFILHSGWPEAWFSGIGKNRNSILQEMPDSGERILIYLLNIRGICVECSGKKFNANLIGTDLSFRRYFTEALEKGSACEITTGTITKRSAVYFARRVKAGNGRVIGVLVVQAEIDSIIGNKQENCIAITGPTGIIHVSNQPEMLHKSFARGNNDRFRIIQPFPEKSPLKEWAVRAIVPENTGNRYFTSGQIISVFVWMLLLTGYVFFLLQRNRFEETLKSKELKQKIFDSSPVGLLVLDAELNVIEFNRQVLNLLEYTENELRKTGICIFRTEKEQALLFAKEAQQKIIEQGSFEFTEPVYTRNGKKIMLHASGKSLSGIPGQNGKFSPEAVWTFLDETEHVRNREQLLICKERFQAFTDYIPEHFFTAAPDGTVLTSSNPLVERAIRSTPGTGIHDFFDESTSRYYLDFFADIVRTGIPATVKHRVVFGNNPPGMRIDTIFPIRHGDKITGIGCFSRNPDEFE